LINLFSKKGIILILASVFFLTAMNISSAAENENTANTVKSVRIAVVPFQAIQPQSEFSSTSVCPLCGVGYSGGKVVEGAERVVEELFIEKLKSFREAEIIPAEKTEAVYKRISAESLKTPLLDILKKVGAELKADYLAVGYVFRYTERIGSAIGVEKPASVAFEVNFISSPKGDTVWRGVFDKTQKSLSEDVFHISSLKWLTARELTKHGIDDAFKTFSGFEH
jgi:TolB-like protein